MHSRPTRRELEPSDVDYVSPRKIQVAADALSRKPVVILEHPCELFVVEVEEFTTQARTNLSGTAMKPQPVQEKKLLARITCLYASSVTPSPTGKAEATSLLQMSYSCLATAQASQRV